MTLKRLLVLAAVVAANLSLGAANLHARTAGTWRYCNCVHPPSNCCVVEADSCNGCVASPPAEQ